MIFSKKGPYIRNLNIWIPDISIVLLVVGDHLLNGDVSEV